MPYVQMFIDSIRRAAYKEEWAIVLQDKSGSRLLPVYVDNATADLIHSTLRRDIDCEVIDAEIENWIREIQGMGGKVVLIIENGENGGYEAGFFGQGREVECGVGKGLAIAVRAEVGIVVEEGFSLLRTYKTFESGF